MSIHNRLLTGTAALAIFATAGGCAHTRQGCCNNAAPPPAPACCPEGGPVGMPVAPPIAAPPPGTSFFGQAPCCNGIHS